MILHMIIFLIIFFGAKDGEALYSQQKQDLELTVAQIMMEKAMAPHSSTLAWKIPWMGSLVGCSPWGCKESDATEHLNTYTRMHGILGKVFLI